MHLVQVVQCVKFTYPAQRPRPSQPWHPGHPSPRSLGQAGVGGKQLAQSEAGRLRAYCAAAPWPLQSFTNSSSSLAPTPTACASQIMAYIMPLPGLPPATPAQLAAGAGAATNQLVLPRPSLRLPPATRQAGAPAGSGPPALRQAAGPVAHRRVVLPVALRHLAAWLPRNAATGLVLVRRTPATLPVPHSSATSPPPAVLAGPRQPAGAGIQARVQPVVVSPAITLRGAWRPMVQQGNKEGLGSAAAATPAMGRRRPWQPPAHPWDLPAPTASIQPGRPPVSSRPLQPGCTQPSTHAAASSGRLRPRTWAASGVVVKAGLVLAASAAALLLARSGQHAGEAEPVVAAQGSASQQLHRAPAAGLVTGGTPVPDAAAVEAGYTAWQVGRLSEALAGYQAEAALLRAEAGALVALQRRLGGSAPAPLATAGMASSTSSSGEATSAAASDGETTAQAGRRWGWLPAQRTSSGVAPVAAVGAPAAGMSVAQRLEVVRGELSSLEVLCEALGAEIGRTQRGDQPPPPSLA